MENIQGYNTKSRKYILEYLQQHSDTTVAASDILKYLENNGISVNLTTVYRYLNKLTLEKKVIKFAGEDGQRAVYQLTGHKKSCDEHLHIQCVRCGKLIHLDCDFMVELKKHLDFDHKFKLQCTGSVLYGVCNNCQKKA